MTRHIWLICYIDYLEKVQYCSLEPDTTTCRKIEPIIQIAWHKNITTFLVKMINHFGQSMTIDRNNHSAFWHQAPIKSNQIIWIKTHCQPMGINHLSNTGCWLDLHGHEINILQTNSI